MTEEIVRRYPGDRRLGILLIAFGSVFFLGCIPIALHALGLLVWLSNEPGSQEAYLGLLFALLCSAVNFAIFYPLGKWIAVSVTVSRNGVEIMEWNGRRRSFPIVCPNAVAARRIAKGISSGYTLRSGVHQTNLNLADFDNPGAEAASLEAFLNELATGEKHEPREVPLSPQRKRRSAAREFRESMDPKTRRMLVLLMLAEGLCQTSVWLLGIVLLCNNIPQKAAEYIYATGSEYFSLAFGWPAFALAMLLFGSLAVVTVAFNAVISRSSNAGARALIEYRNTLNGERSRKVSIQAAAVFAVFALVVCCLCFGTYVRVAEKGVFVRSLPVRAERFYPWHRIKSVETMPSKTSGESGLHYRVVFDDGTRFETLDLFAGNESMVPMVKYIAAQTGKQILPSNRSL